LRTGREIALPADEQTSLVTASFIRILLLLFPTQHLLLLLDRASWHFGEEVRTRFEENDDRLHVMYFPSACPDLNSQEHVWSQAREQVSHNHAYRAFQNLIDDFEGYLNETPFETNFMEKYAPPRLANLRVLFDFSISSSVRRRRTEWVVYTSVFSNGCIYCQYRLYPELPIDSLQILNTISYRQLVT
jgi:transposase